MSDLEWDVIIESKEKKIDLQLKKLWKYRDLLILLVRRDFVSFYKQTIFGPIWFFVQPIASTITYVFIFNNLDSNPVLWIRVDPDMEFIRKVKILQEKRNNWLF